MTPERKTNLTASVHRRLLNLPREKGEDFNLTLTRYAIERFLYRLSRSPQGDRFVLKGALLFTLWTGKPHRPTRALGLMGRGEDSPAAVSRVIRDICTLSIEDNGITFDLADMRISDIREDQEYQGQRVEFAARLGNAVIPVQVDIGFGNAVIPKPKEVEYPTLLGHPAPRLLAYPKETVISEKLQAMIALGIPNSRMKDFYDVWRLSKDFEFKSEPLIAAITATFNRRKTDISIKVPLALSAEFSEDPPERQLWTAFVRRSRIAVGEATLATVIEDIRPFLLPPLQAAASRRDLHSIWPAGGPWKSL